MAATLLARDAQIHQARLVEHLTPYDPAFRERLEALQRFLEPQVGSAQALHKAYAEIYRRTLIEQATLLAFVDNFRWLAVASVLCVPLVLLFQKVKARAPAAAH